MFFSVDNKDFAFVFFYSIWPKKAYFKWRTYIMNTIHNIYNMLKVICHKDVNNSRAHQTLCASPSYDALFAAEIAKMLISQRSRRRHQHKYLLFALRSLARRSAALVVTTTRAAPRWPIFSQVTHKAALRYWYILSSPQWRLHIKGDEPRTWLSSHYLSIGNLCVCSVGGALTSCCGQDKYWISPGRRQTFIQLNGAWWIWNVSIPPRCKS